MNCDLSIKPLSDDITTIVFENYFAESNEQTITYILAEIQRITKNNFACTILEETVYDAENDQTSVTIKFTALDKTVGLTHEDEYGDGSLLEAFLSDQLFPALKGCITKGRILYTCEFSVNFIYFENTSNCEKFWKDFDYYKEI